MPRFVVLLRGVNVGRANRLPMAEFRRVLEEAGFAEVRTLLNSGNAVFAGSGRSSASHARTFADALARELGLSVAVVVRSAREFDAAIAGNPLAVAAQDRSRFLVAFAQQPGALQQLSALAARVQAPERFVIGNHAAYLDCARGILQSRVASALLGNAGRGVTTRNWATVLRLAAMLGVGHGTEPAAKEN